MAILKLKDVFVWAGQAEIIRGVGLEVNEGEVHAIMGQNGSGKSTLLHAIAGNPKYRMEGEAHFDGEPLGGMKPYERARKGIFLAFQHPVEVPGVSLASMLRRAYAFRFGDEMGIAEFERIMQAKAESLGIPSSFYSRPINENMSGGERKMGEILQLSVLEPRLALLDELDSGLDVDALDRVAKAIAKIRKKSMSLVIVTHYARILRAIEPDRVHVLHLGKIAASGDSRLAEKIEEKGYSWVLR